MASDERKILIGAMNNIRAEMKRMLLVLAKNDPATFRRGALALLQAKPDGDAKRQERRALEDLAQGENGAWEEAVSARIASTSLQETIDLMNSGRRPPLRLGEDTDEA